MRGHIFTATRYPIPTTVIYSERNMILRIKIENYKSIRSLDVPLDKFNVIFGKNGSGKTNFISAISLTRALVESGDLEAIINSKIAPFADELFHWKEPRTTSHFEFTVQSKKGNVYIFSYDIAYGRSSGHFMIQSESLQHVLDGKPVSVYKRERAASYAGPDSTEIPFKTEPNKLMLNSYSNEHVLEAIEVLRQCTFVDTALDGREGVSIVPGNRPNLNTIDGLAVSLFIKNGGRFASAVRSIQKILPDFGTPKIASLEERVEDGAKRGEDEANRYFVTWVESSLGTTYSHMSLSHGDRRVIHLIFNLFNADEGCFLAVEEIENGMHYARIARLLDEFRTQASNRNIQILLTTHSTEILNNVLVNEAIQSTKDKEDGTRLTHLASTTEYELIRKDLARDPTPAEMIGSGLIS